MSVVFTDNFCLILHRCLIKVVISLKKKYIYIYTDCKLLNGSVFPGQIEYIKKGKSKGFWNVKSDPIITIIILAIGKLAQ